MELYVNLSALTPVASYVHTGSLVFGRSIYTGPPLRPCTNRNRKKSIGFLLRCLDMIVVNTAYRPGFIAVYP